MSKLRTAFTALSLVLSASYANAQLHIMLDGEDNSSTVQVRLSGQMETLQDGGMYNLGWEFEPTVFNPFPPQITVNQWGMYEFTSGEGMLANLTQGWTTSIKGVWLQDSSNSSDISYERFGVLYDGAPSFSKGDVLQLSGVGTIDLSPSGLLFGDLTKGSTGTLCEWGTCGNLTVAVPEPNTALLMLIGLGATGLHRKYKHMKAQ